MNIKKLFTNKIIKAGSWYTITNFFLKGITFLSIPIFTRLLSTKDYGVVSLYNTWVVIFTIIIGLSLNESIRRAKYDYSDNYNEFVSSITFLSLIIFLVYLIIFIPLGNVLQGVTGLSAFLFYLMIFQSFFTNIQELTMTKLRFEYKYKMVSIISIILGLSGIILSIFLIQTQFEGQSFLGKIIGTLIPIIIIGFFCIFYLLGKGKEFVNLVYWKYALVLSTPLIFHSLSSVANNLFDRILINKYLGDSATGIYSFAYNVAVIVGVIGISLEQAWLPWFFEKFKQSKLTIIKERARIYRNFYTVIYICVLMVSTEIIKVMAAEDFWGGLDILPWIFMAYYFQFMYALEVNVEFALKKTILIPLGTIFSAIINIILNILLIPKFGYMAAAITTVISYFLLFLFHYLMTTKIIKQNIYGFKFHLKSIFYVILATLYFIIFKDYLIIRLFGIIICLMLFYRSIQSFLGELR